MNVNNSLIVSITIYTLCIKRIHANDTHLFKCSIFPHLALSSIKVYSYYIIFIPLHKVLKRMHMYGNKSSSSHSVMKQQRSTVYLSVVNKGYLFLFLNWVCSVEHYLGEVCLCLCQFVCMFMVICLCLFSLISNTMHGALSIFD